MEKNEITDRRAAASGGDSCGGAYPWRRRSTADRGRDAAIGPGRDGALSPWYRPGAFLFVGIDPGAGGAIAGVNASLSRPFPNYLGSVISAYVRNIARQFATSFIPCWRRYLRD